MVQIFHELGQEHPLGRSTYAHRQLAGRDRSATAACA